MLIADIFKFFSSLLFKPSAAKAPSEGVRDPRYETALTQVEGLFSPVVDRMNEIFGVSADDRRFRLITLPSTTEFTREPVLQANISFLTARQVDALRFYHGPEGRYSTSFNEGTRDEQNSSLFQWPAISQNRFMFEVPVDPKHSREEMLGDLLAQSDDREKPVFFGFWKYLNTPASYSDRPSDVLKGMCNKFVLVIPCVKAYGEKKLLRELMTSLPSEAKRGAVPHQSEQSGLPFD